VSIVAPASGDRVPSGRPVLLRGSAFDMQDGALEGAELRWTSDVNGDLGSGTLLDATLAPGRHILKLRATNSWGLTASAQAMIFVTTIKPAVSLSAASYSGVALASESIVAAFGSGLATTTQAATVLPLPTVLSGTTVTIKDSAGTERLAPLFFVSPTQVNYQISPETETGLATVTIIGGDGSVSAGKAQITRVAPGLFTANATGGGVAAAVALRVRADGSLSYEPVAECSNAGCIARPIDLGPES